MNQETFDLAMISGPTAYPTDCGIIVRVAGQHGIVMAMSQATTIWEHHSSDMCAGWLSVSAYSDEEIWDAIKSFVRNRLERLNESLNS